MISALILGRLYGAPQPRTGRTGKPFCTAKLRVAVGDESVFVSVISFRTTVIDALAGLTDGDTIAMTGELTAKVWTDRNGEAKPALDMVCHQVMTQYAVAKKRRAVAPREDSPRADDEPQLELASADGAADAESSGATEVPFDDALPF